MLSERKYRVGMILAHQYISQLDQVRDAVLGNTGTLITFRLGAEDAHAIAKEFAPELSGHRLDVSSQLPHLSEAHDGRGDCQAV